MGTGASTGVNLDQEVILQTLRQEYKVKPNDTVVLLKKCQEEIKKLKEEANRYVFVPPDKQEQLKNFKSMDYNGNNLISLAEID